MCGFLGACRVFRLGERALRTRTMPRPPLRLSYLSTYASGAPPLELSTSYLASFFLPTPPNLLGFRTLVTYSTSYLARPRGRRGNSAPLVRGCGLRRAKLLCGCRESPNVSKPNTAHQTRLTPRSDLSRGGCHCGNCGTPVPSCRQANPGCGASLSRPPPRRIVVSSGRPPREGEGDEGPSRTRGSTRASHVQARARYRPPKQAWARRHLAGGGEGAGATSRSTDRPIAAQTAAHRGCAARSASRGGTPMSSGGAAAGESEEPPHQ